MTDRRQIVDAFLAQLEATKERGIIGAQIVAPEWAGPDSDVRTFECSICRDEMPFDHGAMCGHCERYFCDTMNKGCLEAHLDFVRGGRWG